MTYLSTLFMIVLFLGIVVYLSSIICEEQEKKVKDRLAIFMCVVAVFALITIGCLFYEIFEMAYTIYQ